MSRIDEPAEALIIWRRDGFVTDNWFDAGFDDEIPERGKLIFPLSRWRELRMGNVHNNLEMGVALEAGDDVNELVEDLGLVGLIALNFPKFTDGRSYSAARILRERHGYSGELRAIGEVLLDQIPLMLRCGFDSFAISHEPTRRALASGRLPEVPIHLQPTGERGEAPIGARPWLRRRA